MLAAGIPAKGEELGLQEEIYQLQDDFMQAVAIIQMLFVLVGMLGALAEVYLQLKNTMAHHGAVAAI